MYQAKIYITLHKSVLDPQGAVVTKSLHATGYENVPAVRVGRYLVVDIDVADQTSAEAQAHDMCQKLLANPVIEDYTLEITEV